MKISLPVSELNDVPQFDEDVSMGPQIFQLSKFINHFNIRKTHVEKKDFVSSIFKEINGAMQKTTTISIFKILGVGKKHGLLNNLTRILKTLIYTIQYNNGFLPRQLTPLKSFHSGKRI
ncbi:hypothetical protein HRU45_01660 [Candidatus Dependentiae bacterium]|nr:hypothetical protein [Candidatus Dependentiae bacterium]